MVAGAMAPTTSFTVSPAVTGTPVTVYSLRPSREAKRLPPSCSVTQV